MERNRIFRFFALFVPIFTLLLIISLYSVNIIDAVLFRSYFFGVVISSLNFLIGYSAIRFGINKPNKSFLMIVFGAVVIRFFLIFALIVITISFLYVRLNSFIFTTFTFYFYFLVVEILYLKNLKILIKNE